MPPRAPADPPLLRASGWFLGYRKGPLAMYALREYVGADRVNDALRRLLAAHGRGQPPLPTTRDLYRELEAVTPDSLRSPAARPVRREHAVGAAHEQVAAGARAGRDGAPDARRARREDRGGHRGAVREAPMHDLVEIGAFADAADGGGGVGVPALAPDPLGRAAHHAHRPGHRHVGRGRSALAPVRPEAGEQRGAPATDGVSR
jgi:hypothetical protein